MKPGSAIPYAAVAVFLLVSCSRGADAGSYATPVPEAAGSYPVAVEGMTVSSGRLISEVRGGGVVEGIREAWAVSETEGFIREVNFDLGDRVESGQVLMSVDGGIAARNRDMAEGQYRTAELEYRALEKGRESGSVSELDLSRANDRLLAARAALATADDAWENTSLRAPFSGVVALRDPGLVVGGQLSRGVRAARIIDDSSFQVELAVGEGEVLLVREGAPTRITGKNGSVRTGRVTAVSAGADTATGSYGVIVEWVPEKDDRLRSGMAVDIAIAVEAGVPRPVIPFSAIRRRGDRDYVYIAEDLESPEAGSGRASLREVQPGSRLGDRVEILSGLDEGDILITSGQASLTPGSPVTVTVTGRTGNEE